MIVSSLQEFSQLLKLNHPILAIDYGEKKTGIAISNQERTLSMPLKTIYEIQEKKKISAILDLISTYSACAIVVGLPVHMDGKTSDQASVVLKFIDKLTAFSAIPIYLQDERLTSKAADSLLKSLGMKRKERNDRDDSIAASMLLDTTLGSIAKL